jgi:hypothetical protein
MTGGRELPEPMSDHVLGDEDRHVTPPVVDGDQVFSTLRSLCLFISSIRPSRRASTNGPFLTDRLIALS